MRVYNKWNISRWWRFYRVLFVVGIDLFLFDFMVKLGCFLDGIRDRILGFLGSVSKVLVDGYLGFWFLGWVSLG